MENTPSNTQIGPVAVLLGPTAGGKTELSLFIAKKINAEILSVDSMQVYKNMDIGTAKVSAEARDRIPHHMIDVAEPEETFNAARFCRLACQSIRDIQQRGGVPLLTCGTPFYLKALLWGMFQGPDAQPEIRKRLRKEAQEHGNEHLHVRLKRVDPEAAAEIGVADYKRIERALEVYEVTGRPISALQGSFDGPPRIEAAIAGLQWPRQLLYRRIENRVDDMLEQGLLEEVKGIRDRLGPQAGQAVGYKELISYLDGEMDFEEAVELIKRKTRHFAKDQLGWFKQFPVGRWVRMDENTSIKNAAEECADFYFRQLKKIN